METAMEAQVTEEDLAGVEEMGRKKTEIVQEIHKVIIGQEKVIEETLIALFCRGHCLLVGVPGLAKTLLISTLAGIMELKFNRIQFTPDLMPSDITGTDVIEEDLTTGRRAFRFVKGPVFANILLADEINRTPPKTQAALLEAMQEKTVTVAGKTYHLEEPFMVLATQNPIEQEGTYPLPEAQVDRFMLKLVVGYPSREEERQIMERMAGGDEIRVNAVTTPEAIRRARQVVGQVYVDEKIKDYIINLVQATREPRRFGLDALAPLIAYGASPRATLYLHACSRAHAFLRRRGYVTPEDVKAVALDVLRHRIIVTYEAEAEDVTAEKVARQILERVEVP